MIDHQTAQIAKFSVATLNPHNPEVAGSSPVPATSKSSLERQVSTSFFSTLWQKW